MGHPCWVLGAPKLAALGPRRPTTLDPGPWASWYLSWYWHFQFFYETRLISLAWRCFSLHQFLLVIFCKLLVIAVLIDFWAKLGAIWRPKRPNLAPSAGQAAPTWNQNEFPDKFLAIPNVVQSCIDFWGDVGSIFDGFGKAGRSKSYLKKLVGFWQVWLFHTCVLP